MVVQHDAANLILAGNHYGTRVLDNHLLGSGFRIFAAATESPEHWGWSHAPMFGLAVEAATPLATAATVRILVPARGHRLTTTCHTAQATTTMASIPTTLAQRRR